MIDVLDIKGKKVIFIDELSFDYGFQLKFQDDDVRPGFQIQINCSFYKKPEKLGERIAF